MESPEPESAEELHQCPRCGEGLSIPPDVEISLVLYRHRVDCRLYFRKRFLSDLWQQAKDELKALSDSEDAGDIERRASLKQTMAECKQSLDNPRALRREAEELFARADALEVERRFEAERGHSRGVRRPLHIETIEGKPVLATETSKEFFDKNWEWIEDGRWRRPENLADGTMVWRDYPSTEEGNSPNPHAGYFATYLRFETMEELKMRRNRGYFEAMIGSLYPI